MRDLVIWTADRRVSLPPRTPATYRLSLQPWPSPMGEEKFRALSARPCPPVRPQPDVPRFAVFPGRFHPEVVPPRFLQRPWFLSDRGAGELEFVAYPWLPWFHPEVSPQSPRFHRLPHFRPPQGEGEMFLAQPASSCQSPPRASSALQANPALSATRPPPPDLAPPCICGDTPCLLNPVSFVAAPLAAATATAVPAAPARKAPRLRACKTADELRDELPAPLLVPAPLPTLSGTRAPLVGRTAPTHCPRITTNRQMWKSRVAAQPRPRAAPAVRRRPP